MAKDYTGEHYHMITVLSSANDTKSKWNCLCSCGKKFTLNRQQIWRKSPKSCGCWQGNIPEITISNNLYANYRYMANKRGFVFNIPIEAFRTLIKQDCYYCGKPPSQIKTSTDNPNKLIYTGIDRIDNRIGYELSNVRSCCGLCNRIKSNMTEIEFIEHVEKIYSTCSNRQKSFQI